MNENAKKAALISTYYDSPHGLMNSNNYSCAYDVSRLAAICMKNPDFR